MGKFEPRPRMSTPAAARTIALALSMASLLAACGGNFWTGPELPQTPDSEDTVVPQPNAPAASGNTATDSFNWINYRRGQLGMPQLQRNSRLDRAAEGHATYLRINNLVSHQQVAGNSGYTGADLGQRLAAAGYTLTPPFLYGEVIAATSRSSGFLMTEQLMTAIYHRFAIFEPNFKEAGTGSSTSLGGTIYLTANLAATNGLGAGIATGTVSSYPFDGQTGVPPNFFSDSEEPDPLPAAGTNEVGYPISVQTNSGDMLSVTSFTVRRRGGTDLATKLLIHTDDSHTPQSAAAIIPLSRLSANTVYEVSFSGSAAGRAVTQSWSFTTQ